MIAVVPEDPAERALPAGPGYIRSATWIRPSGHRRISARVTPAYAAEARSAALARAFYQVPIEHIFVPTDGSPVEPLLSFFTRSFAR